MRKQIVLWLLSVCLMCVLCPGQAAFALETGEAEGDRTGYTAISTVEELDAVRNDLDGTYYLAGDLVFAAEDFAEDGAFYNDGAGWIPIGTKEAPFTGTLDGAGHTITGLYVNAYSDGGTVYGGLFGCVSGATLRDLGLVGGAVSAEVMGTATLEDLSACAGGIAGLATDSTVENCFAGSDVTVKATGRTSTPDGKDLASAAAYAGGLLGSQSGGTVTGCQSTGTVTASTETANTDYNSTVRGGGIAGHASGTVTGCENRGGVSVSGMGYSNGSIRAGGITGSGGTVKDCRNEGAVHAAATRGSYTYAYAYSYAGGISGYCGTIQDCGNTGAVTAVVTNSSTEACAGGITGYLLNSASVRNAWNLGDVEATTYAGGVAGYVQSSAVSSAYNEGAVTAVSTGGSGSKACAGGVVGYGYKADISACRNAGTVTATTERLKVNYAFASGFAGGIVAYAYKGGTVTDCYNTGALRTEDCSSPRIGGVAGYVNGDICTISTCYNTGDASASVSFTGGGIIGSVYDSSLVCCTDCYYPDTYSAGVGTGSADGTTACTPEQMTAADTFAGFDFDAVWTMEGSPVYGYPELRALAKELVSIVVSALPDKTAYIRGEEALDVSGGVITLTYTDGTTVETAMTGDMVTGFDNAAAGTCTLTVTYEGKTAAFDVEILAILSPQLADLTRREGTITFTVVAGDRQTVVLVIAAQYRDGRLADVRQSAPLTVDGADLTGQTLTGFVHDAGCTYRVFLLRDAALAPFSPAEPLP